MDQPTLDRHADIARRLKAARWVAGGVQPAKGRKGKPHKVGWKVGQLTAEDLAKRSPLVENGWSADKIGRIERMERNTGPMELEALAKALRMPDLFTDVGRPDAVRLAEDLPALFGEHAPTSADSPAVLDPPDEPKPEPAGDHPVPPAPVSAKQ